VKLLGGREVAVAFRVDKTVSTLEATLATMLGCDVGLHRGLAADALTNTTASLAEARWCRALVHAWVRLLRRPLPKAEVAATAAASAGKAVDTVAKRIRRSCSAQTSRAAAAANAKQWLRALATVGAARRAHASLRGARAARPPQ